MLDNFVGHFAVGALTTRAIVLIGLPVGVLARLLVNGETLRPRRIKLDLHVVDLERLAQVECQIHRVWMLYALEHCLRLPPGERLARAVVVVEELGRVTLLLVVAQLAPRMIAVPKVHVAELAQLALAVPRVVAVLQATLQAVFGRLLHAARV